MVVMKGAYFGLKFLCEMAPLITIDMFAFLRDIQE